jgi:hypothetical protein
VVESITSWSECFSLPGRHTIVRRVILSSASESCASGLPHQIRVSRLSCVSLSIPLEPAIRFHRIP